MSTATLSIDGSVVAELPILVGTVPSDRGIDIRDLRAKTGLCTIDTGFKNTGLTSGITRIDGKAGRLWYRGYDVAELARQTAFLEVAQLLRTGVLPNLDVHALFETMVFESMPPVTGLAPFIAHFPGTRPSAMAMLSSAIGALESIRPDLAHPRTAAEREDAAALLLGQTPTIIGLIAQRLTRTPRPLQPTVVHGYAGTLLYHLGDDGSDAPTEQDAATLEAVLVLHADHEQNCSTTAVRGTGSSGASIFASIASGINALSGPAHGGANEEVEIQQRKLLAAGLTPADVIDAVKNKRLKTLIGDERLMGYGHRVYQNTDARARVLADSARRLLASSSGSIDPRFLFAQELAERAGEDEYFLAKGLYPNVDFWSGFVYNWLAIPVELWTALFAMGRMAGWIAHWEERDGPIDRPWQVYTGPTMDRQVLPLANR